MCAVGVHAPQFRVACGLARGEQPLRRLVHQHDVPFLVGDQNGIGNRVDDQIQPVTLVANVIYKQIEER